MKTDRLSPHPTGAPTSARDGNALRASAVDRLSKTIRTASTAAAALIARVPGSVDSMRAGASDTTAALRTLPDPTLRWLAATSVGLGAGLYLAGVPRIVSAAAVAPAVLMGAAIAGRPKGRAVPA